jgi:hypothetical protein
MSTKTNTNNGYVTDYEDIDDILSEVDKLRLISISTQNNSKKMEDKFVKGTKNYTNDRENLSKMIITNRLKKREEELLFNNKNGEKIVSKNFIDFKKYLTEEKYKAKFTEIGNLIMDSILFDD